MAELVLTNSHDRTAAYQLDLGLVDIRVWDHVVVGYEGYVSFAERGWL
ncbi:hypothetical protein GPM19_05395 [Halomonas sp. ZH2S]|uniref:RadC-like JAB domain-containing protein n=2 Tax=Vreelandella zhuhanensis TaxID=2684210 RepID=A0A7X3KQU0_9GAMM|nr:hypothetical protein [Halomonas zhuhanensis]